MSKYRQFLMVHLVPGKSLARFWCMTEPPSSSEGCHPHVADQVARAESGENTGGRGRCGGPLRKAGRKQARCLRMVMNDLETALPRAAPSLPLVILKPPPNPTHTYPGPS